MGPIRKAKRKLKKHGISFEAAVTVVSDHVVVTGLEPDHSIYEDRCMTFGVSEKGRLVVVSPAEECKIIRIISARKASKRTETL